MENDINDNICEEKVFERIYNSLIKDLSSFLYYKYGAHVNPNDKAQDAFVKLWDNCKAVTLGKAKSFLFTVANNLVFKRP